MQQYTNFLIDQLGRPISSATVEVRLTGTTTKANLFSDNGITVKGNPVTSELDGSYGFWVAPGEYDLVPIAAGVTFDLDDFKNVMISLTEVPSYTKANLPVSSSAGRLAWVTDDVRGVRMYTGAMWAHRNGEAILAADFHVDSSRTAAQNATGLAAALSVLSTRGGGTLVLPDNGTINYDTTLEIPVSVTLVGLSPFTTLNYTGAGFGLRLNNGGALTRWKARIHGFRLTSSTGTDAIALDNVAEVSIRNMYIEGGWTSSAILSTGSGGSIAIRIMDCDLTLNARGIRLDPASGNNHNMWTVVGNRIQGNTVGAGLSLERGIKSWFVSGNDIEGNTGNEIFTALDVWALSIHGNHFETNGAANNAIRTSGVASLNGLSILGNSFFNNGASATGRALLINSTTNRGIHFAGNNIAGYGNTTNPAIDFGGQVVTESIFVPNFFDPTVTTKWGNFSAGATERQLLTVPNSHLKPAYGATITIDASLADQFTIHVTDGVAFTISSPTNPASGMQITIRIRNATGGALGAATFGAAYRLGAAWTQPASGFNRSITFIYDPTIPAWFEISRTTVDIVN